MCPYARFLSCVISMSECALFAVFFFLSGLINVVFRWLLSSSCAPFHYCGLIIPTHRRTLIRQNERPTGLTAERKEKYIHTPLPQLPCREEQNDY